MAPSSPSPARWARAVASIALAALAAGCQPSIPRCGADAFDDDAASYGLILASQTRVEGWHLPEANRTPLAVTEELYFGGAVAGATVGYMSFDGTSALALGTSILRYGEAPRLFESDGWIGSLTLPDLNGRIQFLFGPDQPVIGASFTSDLSGFRVARCLGDAACFHAALRGPTLGPALFMMEANQIVPAREPIGALVLGGALDVGLRF